MRRTSILLFFFLSMILSGCVSDQTSLFLKEKFDFDWQFHPGDIEKGESPRLSTESWRTLDLPHDWSIEGEYSRVNGSDWQSGFLPAGIGWYRKTFDWNPAWKGRLVNIFFEGVYLHSDVWINGHHLGHRPNGYIGFEYSLTKYLRKGKNVIAVRVDQSKPLTGRWYTGSGIYRHVWLEVENKIHIKGQGVSFTTPNIRGRRSEYEVSVAVRNEGPRDEITNVIVSLFNDRDLAVASSQQEITSLAGSTIIVGLKGRIRNPRLWSPDSPYLYSLKTSIVRNGILIDEDEIKVGFRNLEFGSDFGFKLNGQVTKIKGVCDHHTAGSVGSAVPDDVLRYRLNLLKEMGCNAIRTSHNPFSPTFYELCDELGIMVMNEFLDGWDVEKAADDYGLYFEDWWETDGTDFIERDRNHPSVILWSIGNEVKSPTREVQKQLVDLFHSLDPTRPVTQGGIDPTRGMAGDNLPSQLDLKGFNGDGEEIGVLEEFHENFPEVAVICTEVPHTYQTRGVYRSSTNWRRRDFPAMWEVKNGGKMGALENRVFPIPDLAPEEVFPEEITTEYYQNGTFFPIENDAPWSKNLYYQSSYDNASVRSSARKAWQRTRDMDFIAGQFRWGSFDYLGESNDWPSRFANFGVIDICGFPKDHFYLYKSMWTKAPMVHVLPHWNHQGKEGIKIPVVVYTNCDEVELFLNDKSLGSQKYQDEQLVWMVPYKPGTIKAVSKTNGVVVAADSAITAGVASKIGMTPDRGAILANRTDVVHLAVEITDEDGVFCPMADNVVSFDVSGPARIIGIDNGDPLDLSSYKTNVRRAFRGKIMLLLQATDEPGLITVTATSDNMISSKAIVISE